MIERTSESFSRSAEIGPAWIWTSSRNPSGKRGRIGRSMRREERISLVVGRPLALDEAAGELARGVDLLAVIDGEREEVEAFAAGAGDGGDQGHRVAHPDDDGAAGPAWRVGRTRWRWSCHRSSVRR